MSFSYPPGATILIDFPGSVIHGRQGAVIKDDQDFDYGDGMIRRLVWVSVPGLFPAVGVHPAHISGTAEAVKRRRWEADVAADDRQGELLL